MLFVKHPSQIGRKDEQKYGEYRTKRVILEIYDEMKRAMEMGEVYRTRLEPGLGDRAVAHEGRIGADLHTYANKGG